MAGYYGYSMSNNAIEAYENGEKPLSKWTKADIITEIENQGIELKCSIENLERMPVKALKELCLAKSSWHHTSSHYNRTYFYSLDAEMIECLTDKRIEELIAQYAINKKIEPSEERWECKFLEWSGTRNHPKATEITEVGTIRGGWFYRDNGEKKKVSANGFRKLRRIEEAK